MSAEHPYPMTIEELEVHLRLQHGDQPAARGLLRAIGRRKRRIDVDIGNGHTGAAATAPGLTEIPGQEPRGGSLHRALDKYPCVECDGLVDPSAGFFVLLSDGWHHGEHFTE